MAEWIVGGEPSMDLWPVDIRRFGEHHHDTKFLIERTTEATGKHYTMAWPSEEHESGRPLKTSPLYERLKSDGGCFGSKFGWERPNWFMPSDDYALSVEDLNQSDPSQVLLNKNHSNPLEDGRIVEKLSLIHI